MGDINGIMASLAQELRRGTIVLGALGQLTTPQYGYTLVKNLKEKGIDVDTNTLYPLLRRLEKQEILTSEWETDGNKPRKYYRRTELGNEVLGELTAQWRELSKCMELLLKEEDK